MSSGIPIIKRKYELCYFFFYKCKWLIKPLPNTGKKKTEIQDLPNHTRNTRRQDQEKRDHSRPHTETKTSQQTESPRKRTLTHSLSKTLTERREKRQRTRGRGNSTKEDASTTRRTPFPEEKALPRPKENYNPPRGQEAGNINRSERNTL